MLADLLRDARLKRHLTQADLARALGCTTGYVAHFEGGRAIPSESKLLRLGDILNLDKRVIIRERQKEKASKDARAYYDADEANDTFFRQGHELTREQLSYALKVIRAVEKNRRLRDAIDLLIEKT